MPWFSSLTGCVAGIIALALWNGFLRLKSRGFRFTEDFVVVKNLDVIKTRTIGFRFNGKVHKIRPLSVEKFAEAMAAQLAITELMMAKKRVKTEAELLDAYEGVFSIVCPSITRKDLDSMSIQQICSLYDTVFEFLVGSEEFQAQKKSKESSVSQETKRPFLSLSKSR